MLLVLGKAKHMKETETHQTNPVFVSPCGRWAEAVMHENPRMDRCVPLVTRTVDLAKEHHLKRLLFDLSRVTREDTQAEQFQKVRKMGETGLDRTYRVAFLISPGSTDNDFIAMAFVDAGYNVQYFTCRDLAQAWLIDG